MVRGLCPYKQAIEKREAERLFPCPDHREGMAAPGFFHADPQCAECRCEKDSEFFSDSCRTRQCL